MGNWKIQLPESTSKDHVLGTISSGLPKYYAGEPRVNLGHFSPSLQNSLKRVIEQSYQAEADEKPSADDISRAYDILSKYLAAYLMGQSSDDSVTHWVVSQFPRHQTQPLQSIFHNKSQTPEARYHAESLNRARGLFASLLEITTVDNINIFGNALRQSNWGLLEMTHYWGRVDMVKFSQEYKKPDLALNIIKAMGDAGVWPVDVRHPPSIVLRSWAQNGPMLYLHKFEAITIALGFAVAEYVLRLMLLFHPILQN
ncbi:unnamed protein product [Aspergillus oryzae RIB40]|uniref:DNA, SC102 n=1 Tax=Aspergillus oryzae (strain ATCC 42149 / RIB 40) TaxID=510516 RepID=Q2UAS2_ASPOR|nr:unnamed protein product [Aspergillus oryzae RIB40]BAE61343.1 unnamed protein product [Aspergillus oryzae RIB40]